MPGVLSPMVSLKGGRWLDIFLGGRAMHLILCLDNILLSRPKVVCVYGRYAVENGLVSSLVVCLVGSKARLICCGL